MAIAAMASGLLLVGCASNNGGGSGPETEPGAVGIIGDQADGGTPVDGGTLSFAGYSPVASLDPTKTQPAGSTGGTEMAAVYDLLVRYDAESQSYKPQLAESLTSSEDYTTWTITLRDGVTFSDGTPLDAAAVVASTNRFNEKRGANTQAFQAGVKSVEATDASTVVYTMNQPWSEFPSILVFGHGMIVAAGSDQPDGTFTPVGAGPFAFESMAPGSELVLTAREDYWNGKPHLDTLKFVDIKDDRPKIEALDTGGIQMGFLLNAASIDEAKATLPGFYETLGLSNPVVQINQRDGRPGADLRVRKAMQLAIDPEVIDMRAKDGKGMPGTEIFQSWSKWHNDVPPVALNTGEATELVDAAKTDGFDGTITYFTSQTQAGQAAALAIQAMLAPVGIDVNIEYGASITDIVKRIYVDKDFDIATGAYSISDAAPFLRLFNSLHSTSTNNILGVDDPKMDQLLSDVQTAKDDDTKRAAMASLQTEVNETAPYLALSAGANFVPWTDNVHGAVPSLDSIILLDQAWIQ
ncbi:ABC transporter substrate-binding protein [Rhodococcus sp. PAMC28707]|uniref:ABC transporter substrate-binding protein n=1 Tax=unclassified Rhodococcus (in: high G+C Gram-positive bacteria) TaxID=192944 RepID=UPI00109D8AE5|nr:MULTISPECIES: ABC transporter substrate-binding protein [unclassified Rhodococcus (in: high G+C Gram-positive bacteria)]QCB49182.1 ABC transporter substrate-binding protein [Rhodococcus sp. PAMC28705]QCB59129.1 ABC transporter substrate-binding protein [Rhodococcus sp. PAMC28707]